MAKRRLARGVAVLGAIFLASLGGRSEAYSQALADDPVEALRHALKTCSHEPQERDRKLRQIVPTIRQIGDLRRAAVLREWRDHDAEEKWAVIDRTHRAAIVGSFARAARDMLRQGDETARLAMLSVLSDLALASPADDSSRALAREFAADLVKLIKENKPTTRLSAARVLAQVDPEPSVAVPAFAALLASKDAAERAAAVDDVTAWMHRVAELATHDFTGAGTVPTRLHLIKVGEAVARLAGQRLTDADVAVRRGAVRAVAEVADVLRHSVTARLPDELAETGETEEQRQAERKELLPLNQALRERGAALIQLLSDPDSEVVPLARQALEDMSSPQLWLSERAESNSGRLPAPVVLTSSSAHDSLRDGLERTVGVLAAGLAAKEPRARRTVVHLLEGLGPAAAPAADALVGALADSDRFVRWAAARTLGKISPMAAESAVPSLAHLLEDDDLDLRLAAATALERYGPKAGCAVPALIDSAKSTETELRLMSLRALGAIGEPAAHSAVVILRASLSDPDHRVRQVAAVVLGKFPGRDVEDALRKALQDTNLEVQKAAGEALLHIRSQ